MKQLARYTVTIFVTLGVLLLLWQFRSAVALFILSLFVAATLRPLIARLIERKIPAAAARTFVFLTLILILIIPFIVFGNGLLEEVQHLGDRLTLSYELNFVRWQAGSDFEKTLTTWLPRPDDLYETMAGDGGAVFFNGLFGATQGVLGFLGGLLLVFLLSLYWSSDQDHFERLWLSLLPASKRMQARDTWRAIESAIGGYLRSGFLQSTLAAFFIGGGMALLDAPYPILAGVAAAIAWLIPLAGAALIILFVLAQGYTISLGLGAAAAIYTLLVLCFLEFIVEPRFYDRNRYSSLLVILLMWPMASLLGLPGLILAPAFAAALQLLLRQLLQPNPIAKRRVQVANLESRYDKLYDAFSNHTGEPYPPEIANILDRLSNLLQQTKTTLRES